MFFVWLELVGAGGGPSSLFVVLVGYTAFTLAMMAQFGRDAWRRNGETFSVWFRLLNRLAPFGLVDDEGRVQRRPFASGLLLPGWTTADIVLVAIGTGSILYDGLSQTTPWFSVFGAPAVPIETLQLLGFLGIIALAALAVARLVGTAATGAGLLPIAVGYLIAHYFTYLLHRRPADHRRHRRSAPAGLGPRRLRLGVLRADAVPSCRRASSGRSRSRRSSAATCSARGVATSSPRGRSSSGGRSHRTREVPLAVIMVALTTLTLWSLGQSLVVEAPAGDQAPGSRHRPSRCRSRPPPASRRQLPHVVEHDGAGAGPGARPA